MTLKKGDVITIDGSTGQVLAGRGADARARSCRASSRTLMGWADEVRQLKVRANAETPADAATARKFGAEGIGLCRTEHMFFDERPHRRGARDDPGRRREGAPRRAGQAPADAARRLRRAVRDHGRPAGDHPPARSAAARVPAAQRRRRSPRSPRPWAPTPTKLRRRAAELHEFNPMLGYRGCRLGDRLSRRSTRCRRAPSSRPRSRPARRPASRWCPRS